MVAYSRAIVDLSEASGWHLQASANGMGSYLVGPYRLVTRRCAPLSLLVRQIPLDLKAPIRLASMVIRLPSRLSLAVPLGAPGPVPLLLTSSVPAAPSRACILPCMPKLGLVLVCRIILVVVVGLRCLRCVRLPIIDMLVAILPRIVAWAVFLVLTVLRQDRCLVI